MEEILIFQRNIINQYVLSHCYRVISRQIRKFETNPYRSV